MSIDRRVLEELVREVVKETLTVSELGSQTPAAGRRAEPCDDGVCVPRDVKPQRPLDPFEAKRVVDATPARVVQGRTGTRYMTSTYIGLRAEHAIAIDAVASRIPAGFAAELGCIELRTRCKDQQEFLLYPDHGRRLDDESRDKLLKEGTRGADVQVIAGDGLSAWALTRQAKALLPALDAALRARGFSVGKPVLVHFARIGVADEIGVQLQSKCTVILVGERPGLGTGDSLSIYTAYQPRLGQDNAEKNCISNIRPLGVPLAEGAEMCAALVRKTFDAGGGGIHLVRPQRDVIRRQG
jgi:ethanolamine ammonia-lyase small subunit